MWRQAFPFSASIIEISPTKHPWDMLLLPAKPKRTAYPCQRLEPLSTARRGRISWLPLSLLAPARKDPPLEEHSSAGLQSR